MDNDLLIAIGGDISNFTKSLKQAETRFSELQKNISAKGINFSGSATKFAKEMKKVEKIATDATDKIKNEMSKALHNGLDFKDLEDEQAKAITAMASQYRKVSLAAEESVKKEIATRKELRAKLKSMGVNVGNTKDIAKLEALYNKEKILQKETANTRQRLQSAYITNRNRDIHKLASLKGDLNRKEYAAELKRLRNLTDLERRRAIQAANSKINNAKATGRGGFGERSFLDSVGIVAKYGAISQALYGVQNAFSSAVGETVRFDQAIQDNIAVLNKSNKDATILAKNVVNVGKTYGIALDEVQQGMLTVGRAGVEGTEQLKEATEVLSALAVLTGDTMSEGAEFASSMLAVYPKLADMSVTLVIRWEPLPMLHA